MPFLLDLSLVFSVHLKTSNLSQNDSILHLWVIVLACTETVLTLFGVSHQIQSWLFSKILITRNHPHKWHTYYSYLAKGRSSYPKITINTKLHKWRISQMVVFLLVSISAICKGSLYTLIKSPLASRFFLSIPPFFFAKTQDVLEQDLVYPKFIILTKLLFATYRCALWSSTASWFLVSRVSGPIYQSFSARDNSNSYIFQ